MKKDMKEIWSKIITDFNREVKTSVAETKVEVTKTYKELVICQEKTTCCEYPETVIDNLWIQVTMYRTKIVTESNKWLDFEKRRHEMYTKCGPDNIDDECPNVCFNGDARVDCLCLPEVPFPACPTSACSDGSVRAAADCDCPQTAADI